MRTTKDLLEELRATAEGAVFAAIVVKFQERTEFVFANVSDPLRDLNAMVNSGGDPIALLRATRIERGMNFSFRALDEHANESYVDECLDALPCDLMKPSAG